MYKRREWSIFEDEEIIAGYRNRQRGTNQRLARRIGVLPTAISARAVQLGCPPLITRSKRTPYQGSGWSDHEKKLLINTQMEAAAVVVEKLVAAGYPRRTPAAINSVRLRMRKAGDLNTRRNELANRDMLTVLEICAGMGCKVWQVARWIRTGKLTASRIGGNAEYVVHRQALFRFLRDHVGSWDHRGADRWFLVDILAGTRPNRKILEAAKMARTIPHAVSDVTL